MCKPWTVKSGIIGARGSGKSTVFQALTGLAPVPGVADARNRARLGQIKVSDPRLDFLEQAYESRKKIPVQTSFLHFCPKPKEEKKSDGLEQNPVPFNRGLEALLFVVPEF